MSEYHRTNAHAFEVCHDQDDFCQAVDAYEERVRKAVGLALKLRAMFQDDSEAVMMAIRSVTLWYESRAVIKEILGKDSTDIYTDVAYEFEFGHYDAEVN